MLGYSLAMLELLDGPDFVHRCLWHNHGNLNTDWIFDIQELSLVLNMNSNMKLCFHSPDILRDTLTYSWVQGMYALGLIIFQCTSKPVMEMSFAIR